MNTSYNEIYQAFLNNCKVSDIDLPSTDEGKYEQIKNALMYFNNRMGTSFVANDETETVNGELSESHLLILANYIRWVFLINQKTYFESLWQPFSSDVGIKNFGTQIKSLESSIEKQEDIIDSLIFNTMDDFL